MRQPPTSWRISSRARREPRDSSRPPDRAHLAARQAAVPVRHHQGRPRRLPRGRRAGHAPPHRGPAAQPRALPGRRRGAADLPAARGRALPELDPPCHGPQGGRNGRPCRRRRRGDTRVPRRPGGHHAARLAEPRRPARAARPPDLRPRSQRRNCRRRARRGLRNRCVAARPRARAVRDDHGLARLPRRCPPPAARGLRRGARLRPRRRADCRRAQPATHARAAQGGPGRADPRRRHAQHLRAHGGRAVLGARAAGGAGGDAAALGRALEGEHAPGSLDPAHRPAPPRARRRPVGRDRVVRPRPRRPATAARRAAGRTAPELMADAAVTPLDQCTSAHAPGPGYGASQAGTARPPGRPSLERRGLHVALASLVPRRLPPPARASAAIALAAPCSQGRARGARRTRRHLRIGRGLGSGALIAHSSTEVLQGTFLANAGGGLGRSCGHVVGGGTVCFTNNPLFGSAGRSTWYALGRRPDLGGVVHADARTWLADARGKTAEGTTPAAGAIAVWLPGAGGADRLHGHVAYVSAVADGGKTVVVDEANWVPGLVSLGRRVRATEIAGYIYRPGADAGSPGAGGSAGTPAALPAADTDGDGVADVADACPLQAGSPAHAGCPPASRLPFGDFTADGRHDAAVVRTRHDGHASGVNYNVLTSTGSGLTPAGVWGTADDVDVPSSRFVSGDFDNDGKEDILAVTARHDRHPSGATYSVLTSTGSKFNAARQWSFSEDVDIAASRFLSADTTNDARDDLVVVSPRSAGSPSGADYTVLASTGSAFNNTGLWGSAADVDIAASRFLSGDLNNDARDDLVVVTPRRATHPSGATYNAVTSTGSKFNSPAAWRGAGSLHGAAPRFGA